MSGRVTPFPGRVESQNLDPRATLRTGSSPDLREQIAYM